jgi:hypothetical protein
MLPSAIEIGGRGERGRPGLTGGYVAQIAAHGVMRIRGVRQAIAPAPTQPGLN